MAELKFAKLTEADFELFKAECIAWIKFFGLDYWSVRFEHMTEPGDNGAEIEYSLSEKWCIIRLGAELSTQYGPLETEIRRCAIHEVTHLLTLGLKIKFMDRWATAKDFDADFERIALHMENAFYPYPGWERTPPWRK